MEFLFVWVVLRQTLPRINSFSNHQNQDKFVEMMIDESKHFIEWTTLEAQPEIQSESVDLQIQQALWQRNWSLIWMNAGQRAVVAELASRWSDRVLNFSGLLNKD